jgi:stage II sporulation protein D
MTLVYEGKYINAWFHSCSGGKTATATEGLNYKDGNPPYIQVVDSPEDEAPAEFQNWERTFSTSEVQAALKKIGVDTNLTSVSITERGESGRCTQLEIGGKQVNCVDFRVALDPLRFRSTYLTSVSVEDGSLVVAGKGYGHGVGMSQWGAFTMAKQNKTYEDILHYYYKDVQIVKAW